MRYKVKTITAKNLANLLVLIEKNRKKLVEAGMSKGFQDCEVLRMSQELDKLLVEYYEREKQLEMVTRKEIINK